jgi:secondary thiamine-phosphate synthase enzyme
MSTYYTEILKKSNGNCDIINITEDVSEIVRESSIKNGIVTVFSIGSTTGITTLEFEPGLLKDVPAFMDKILPQFRNYHHNDTWGDGNGHSHLRSALTKTSLTVPFVNSEMTLGTWQQIIFIDFDNRNRTRRIAVQVIGD